ncbi:unnamed protein product [Protopolystoma xenopodis]|uniref:Uncharacterized protein n=1 Tax=Protopolystoma xenopodis TaxID=117903 RepID=A0A448WGS8_9PLAT|nr:unnamed protein product [Protopolystoma xenopodis]
MPPYSERLSVGLPIRVYLRSSRPVNQPSDNTAICVACAGTTRLPALLALVARLWRHSETVPNPRTTIHFHVSSWPDRRDASYSDPDD